MSTTPVNNLSSSYLQSVLVALQAANSTAKAAATTVTSVAPSKPDSSQLSPLAKLMSTLQQLQESDPAKYKDVTKQIATNLQSAAQSAASQGDTAAAGQLNQLASDFTTASTTGQLPNIQDLAQAVGGHHGHHHHGHAAPAAAADSDAASSTSSSTTSPSSSTVSSASSSQALSQLLAAFQSTETQNSSFDPASIISNTLSRAGIGESSS